MDARALRRPVERGAGRWAWPFFAILFPLGILGGTGDIPGALAPSGGGPPASPLLSGEQLVLECGPALGTGDNISRAFYIPSFPSDRLERAEIGLIPWADGSYRFTLAARGDTFDGALIGTAFADATMTANVGQTISFLFSGASVGMGRTLTFQVAVVSGPAMGAYLDVGPCGLGDLDCSACGGQIIETNDATPPLSSFRRNSVYAKVYAPECSFDLAVTVPAVAAAGIPVAFSAVPSGSDCLGEYEYDWDFGDGSPHGAGASATHAYALPGVYAWTCAARNGAIVVSKSGTLTVSAPLPGDCDLSGSVSIGEVQKAINMFLGTLPVACGVDCNRDGSVSIGEVQKAINAFLGLDVSCCTLDCAATATPIPFDPSDYRFQGTASATNCLGAPAFAWDFGDGSSAEGESASHRYTSAGTFTWTLTVTVDGRTCTRTGVITVDNPPCVVTCGASAAPDSGAAPLEVSFNATVETSNCGEEPAADWFFGDGFTAAGLSATHTYTSGGTFTWSFFTRANSIECSKSGTITVTGAPSCVLACTADIVADPFGGPPGFMYYSSVSTLNCIGEPAYLWSFGDGTTSALATGTHVYPAPGTYIWTLTVTVDGQVCEKSGTVEF